MHRAADFDSEQGGGQHDAVDNDACQYALEVPEVMLVQWMQRLNALTASKLVAAECHAKVADRNFLKDR